MWVSIQFCQGMGHCVQGFQEDFLLHEKNKAQHKILQYDIARERNFESSSTLQ